MRPQNKHGSKLWCKVKSHQPQLQFTTAQQSQQFIINSLAKKIMWKIW